MVSRCGSRQLASWPALLYELLIHSLSSCCYSFGYVVEGADLLQDVKEGDVIVSAKITSGAENLVQPK
jgi:hypothetical protein